MGFRKSRDKGWGHEVWYHDSNAWVHYGNHQAFEKYDSYGSNGVKFNGDTDSMTHFFVEFIENVKAGEASKHMVVTEDW